MKIAVIGLGLIGGSIAKAIKQKTSHLVYGIDADQKTISSAIRDGAVDAALEEKDFSSVDILFVCLYPRAAVSFILENMDKLKKGCIVTDVCGVKKFVEDSVGAPLRKRGLHYVGGHPMAGKERSGYFHSNPKMLEGASYILTKNKLTDEEAFEAVKQLIASLGCRVVETTSEKHDRIIAYTSQLAHVVSSSYIKSPTVEYEKGFTGGSFQDMTRVALLSPPMWAELFTLNRENLLFEIRNIIQNLKDFEAALSEGDGEKLISLLREGSEIKKRHLEK